MMKMLKKAMKKAQTLSVKKKAEKNVSKIAHNKSNNKKAEPQKGIAKTKGKTTMNKTTTKTKQAIKASEKNSIKAVSKRATKEISTLTEHETNNANVLQRLPLQMRTDLGHEASRAISNALNLLLADVFALFVKTKNFHWHVSGPHFRDYHLLFDDQAAEILGMVDRIAERVRKVGGTTIHSIGHIAQLQRVSDNNADYVEPSGMLAELYQDNLDLTTRLREVHSVCDEYNDTATTSLIDGWIDESEQRSWFLYESSR